MIHTLKKLVPSGLKKKIITGRIKKKFDEGYKEFLKTGETSEEAYQALINLYCATGGSSLESLAQPSKNKIDHECRGSRDSEKLTDHFEKRDIDKIADELDINGYSVFDQKLDDKVVDQLIKFAFEIPAIIKKDHEPVIYDPAHPKAELYRFKINDLIDNPVIQDLIMHPALIKIARNYLGSEPIFDFPAMWWSTAFSKEASADGAQLYHFDMDRIKWLKIFFYLTDVGGDNGPHCYIAGSHLDGNKPLKLLERGYARIPDEDLRPYYKQTDFKEITAKKGTIFAGDTKCWHKGKPLTNGHRLVLELEYTSSLFGTAPKIVCKDPTTVFQNFCKENQFFASNIIIS